MHLGKYLFIFFFLCYLNSKQRDKRQINIYVAESLSFTQADAVGRTIGWC